MQDELLELDLRYGEFKWEFPEEVVPIIIKAIAPVQEATLEIVTITPEEVPEIVVPEVQKLTNIVPVM